MASDLGKGYQYKKISIKFPNGDIYEGMGAAYYDSEYEPHGEGTYFNKRTGVTFKADWEHRRGPDFKTIKIIDKPKGEQFVLVQAYAGEIYSNLVYLGIINAKVGTYAFKDLECIVLEPHSWPKHLFVIKQISENELIFDFAGPTVDNDKFANSVAPRNEPKELQSVVASHIIWDHDDEYDVSQSSSIKVLYF